MDALLKPRSGGNYITYDPSFKLQVTEYWLGHPAVSSRQISEMFHASREAIRNWWKIYLEQSADASRKEMRGKSKNMKNGKDRLWLNRQSFPTTPKDA